MSSTLRVKEVNQTSTGNYLVVTDDKESERDSSLEENKKFKELCEDFLREKYEDHISILSTVIDHQGETRGSAWVRIDPKTPGILETIAEDYGLSIQKTS